MKNLISNMSLNERSFNLYRPLKEELAYPLNRALLFDLPNPGVLSVGGEKAREFLQGQLTTDVRKLDSYSVCPAALCSVQGRILNLMELIEWQGLKLIMPEDMLAQTEANLRHLALLSRVNLQTDSSLSCLGLYCPNSIRPDNFPLALPQAIWQGQAGQESYSYAVSPHLRLILLPASLKASILDQWPSDQRYGSLAWHAHSIREQRLSIYPDTRGLFLPHRLGLEKTAYLCFNKGCYKGQEIIARTHYRAKPKHGLYRYQISTPECFKAGDTLWNKQGDSEIGEIIDYCPLDHHRFLILISALFEHPREVKLKHATTTIDLDNDLQED